MVENEKIMMKISAYQCCCSTIWNSETHIHTAHPHHPKKYWVSNNKIHNTIPQFNLIISNIIF